MACLRSYTFGGEEMTRKRPEKKVKPVKLQSNFALLDVKAGRARLTEMLGGYPEAYRPEPARKIPVIIKGFITHQWGQDDGISREFSVDITSVSITPLPRKPVTRGRG
jgi:hypothetical protein